MKYLFWAALISLGGMLSPFAAQAEDTGSYLAAIWVDPDGCEHWVLDLGTEGMMSPHLDRDGKPICGRPTNICMEFPGDVLFDTGKADLTQDAIDRLKSYFAKEMADGTTAFIINGHTDSRGSALYNFDLARARAQAVAGIAQQLGAMTQVESFGEMRPVASNDTEDGRRRNRRVEIICE